jgi:hypothetical protein
MNEHDYPGDDAPPPDIDLSQFDDDFAEAPIEEREFDEVPDGKFQVSIDKVELTTAKSSGNAMLKWTLRILGPHCAGRLLWRNNVIATRENVRWLKNDLHICGLELVKLSELREHLEQLLDVQLEVTKRTRGDSVNIYFNRRLVLDEQGSGAAHARASKDGNAF